MWTKSACVVLAWSILLIVVMAICRQGSPRQAQANIRIASSTQLILNSTPSVVSTSAKTTSPTRTYVVQQGDTLSGIAAQLTVRGGWPALYAANRPLIGPDPDIIHPGTVLVLPGQEGPVRYTVAAGDTLSGIAAALAVRGGWPALYAADRRVIGPDPNVIRPGTVLTVPGPAAPPTSKPAPPTSKPTPPASRPAPPASKPQPPSLRTTAPAAAGMPQWLKIMLLAAAVVIALVFLVELMLVVRRQHQLRLQASRAGTVDSCQEPAGGPLPADQARIVMADYDRVVVTCSKPDDTVLVLRPPGEDPKAVLRAARLVLAEGPYGELADQLGEPAGWPME
jgi:LysM repeat protein